MFMKHMKISNQVLLEKYEYIIILLCYKFVMECIAILIHCKSD